MQTITVHILATQLGEEHTLPTLAIKDLRLQVFLSLLGLMKLGTKLLQTLLVRFELGLEGLERRLELGLAVFLALESGFVVRDLKLKLGTLLNELLSLLLSTINNQ